MFCAAVIRNLHYMRFCIAGLSGGLKSVSSCKGQKLTHNALAVMLLLQAVISCGSNAGWPAGIQNWLPQEA
jgi:hypothetical protein